MTELPGTPLDHSRRSDLFLVRLWTTDASEEPGDTKWDGGTYRGRADSIEKSASGPARKWWGKVQRAVSGESHEFADLQGLLELLKTMLSESTRR